MLGFLARTADSCSHVARIDAVNRMVGYGCCVLWVIRVGEGMVDINIFCSVLVAVAPFILKTYFPRLSSPMPRYL